MVKPDVPTFPFRVRSFVEEFLQRQNITVQSGMRCQFLTGHTQDYNHIFNCNASTRFLCVINLKTASTDTYIKQ
jgi:hypothetical protein